MAVENITEAIEQCQKMAHHLDHDGNWNLALLAKAELEKVGIALRVAVGFVERGNGDPERQAEALKALKDIGMV